MELRERGIESSWIVEVLDADPAIQTPVAQRMRLITHDHPAEMESLSVDEWTPNDPGLETQHNTETQTQFHEETNVPFSHRVQIFTLVQVFASN